MESPGATIWEEVNTTRLSLEPYPVKPYDFPLVELHRHLEGSARPRTLYEAGMAASDDPPGCLSSWLAADAKAGRGGGGRSGGDRSGGDRSGGDIDIAGGGGVPSFRDRFPTLESFVDAAVLSGPCSADSGDPDETGLTACMRKFELIRVTLATSPDVVERVARETVLDAHGDGVRLLELRYSPLYIQSANTDAFPTMRAVHDAVKRGIEKAEEDGCRVALGLVGIVDRCWPLEMAWEEADFIFDNAEDFVGIDLANDESRFPAAPFAPIFRKANAEYGLSATVHAAEVSVRSGHENAMIAMELLGAKRLGHGIGILSDPSGRTLEEVKRRGVTVECCPTSNLRAADVKSYEDHPIRALLDLGVNVAVSTDDPGLFGITLLWELRNLEERGVLTIDEIRRCNEAAYRASFIDAAVKERYFVR